MKDKIRPIYSELQGLLSQTPLSTGSGNLYDDTPVWLQLEQCIAELNNLTGQNYDRFKTAPPKISQSSNKHYISLADFRTKIGSLITRLHAEYFSTESTPFSGSPSTVISQNQTQQQAVNVSLLLEIQSIIDEKLAQTTKPEEKNFLTQLKSTLPSVKTGLELFKLILELAHQCGLDLNSVTKLFG